VLTTKFKKIAFYLLPILSISVLFLNLNNANVENKKYQKTWFGFEHFYTAFFDADDLCSKALQVSAKNIHVNRLSNSIRHEIQDQSIDFYPWDVSYASANGLNWQPRSSFQSLGIAKGIDESASENYSKENGPAYVLFHYVVDSMGGHLGGVDYSYLLNIEPLTISQLINGYNIVTTTDRFALLKQSQQKNLEKPELVLSQTMTWNTWYECPEAGRGILKLKTNIGSSVLGGMLKLLYKDSEYIIDYEMEDGTIKPYRLNVQSAENGIWIGPLLANFNDNELSKKTKRIRFRVKNQSYTRETFDAQWTIQRPSDTNTHFFLK